MGMKKAPKVLSPTNDLWFITLVLFLFQSVLNNFEICLIALINLSTLEGQGYV